MYGSRFNLLKMVVLGALSDITGIEMVGPQLAKAATHSYEEALKITRRRQHILLAALVVVFVMVLF